jgi:hypothetical protein
VRRRRTPRAYLTPYLLLLGSQYVSACETEVSLGHWERLALPTVSADADAPTALDASGSETTDVGSSQVGRLPDAGIETPSRDAATGIPACMENLGVGQLSPVNSDIRVSETATDWSLSEPVSELEWTLMIEQDVPTQNEEIGYYWHNQFSFVPGVAGRFGLQSRGFYQETPTATGEFTKIVVFWLSGPPLKAELGDIPFPEARAFAMTAAGLQWQTIHAKFDWEECHTYRFRVGVESTETDGNVWYGAWVTDETTATVTFLGRMLVPADSGLLSSFSSSRTLPIYYQPQTCGDLWHVSAVFGAPTSGTQTSSLVGNHFMAPAGCARSIIGNFNQSVRHELGATR